ncbi:MAG: hypothetical protein F4Y41_21315 [Gammaproteobacteria bacterium]|nr:hypothetical protein [Gammaproteobacteria bacterium]
MNEKNPAARGPAPPQLGRYRDAFEPLGFGNRHAFFRPLREFVLAIGDVAGTGTLGAGLEIGDHRGIDGGAQRLVEHRLADQIIRQRRTPALLRPVVGVHVAADLVEGDTRRERARH